MTAQALPCPDCATPMVLLEQTRVRVLYLCPSCYEGDPRLMVAAGASDGLEPPEGAAGRSEHGRERLGAFS